MKNLKTALGAALVCAALAASPAAFAKNNKGNHGQGHGGPETANWNNAGNRGLRDGDRDILRGYVIGHYKRHCPPGLAKKNPPCIPPGQAKKYGVGSTLPERGWSYVPDSIASLLTLPPKHARYVRAGKNVYLVTEGTRKVLEAIELFSQVD